MPSSQSFSLNGLSTPLGSIGFHIYTVKAPSYEGAFTVVGDEETAQAAVMLEMRFAFSARDFADRTLRPRSAAASLVDQNHTLPPYKIPITRMGTLYGG